ncbi:MAG: hypothetical protein WC738_02365 [Candidatus Omnitrophota bacterium]|jgi:hypothetical protein
MSNFLEDKIDSIKNGWLVVFIFAASFICCAGYIWRNYGADESTFLLLSRMATEGVFPVRDYYSQHTPYTVFMHGFLMKLFGFNIYVARTIIYVLSSSIAVFTYLAVVNAYKRRSAAIICTGLFMVSSLYLFEGSPLESAGHSQTALFFIMLAMLLSSLPGLSSHSKRFSLYGFSIGICLAAAVWCRSAVLLPAAVIFLNFIYNVRKNTGRTKNALLASVPAIGGAILGSSLAIYLFFTRPDTFIFCYLKGSSFYREIVFHPEYGSYIATPWLFRFNVLVDFLRSYGGQTAILLILFGFAVLLVAASDGYKRYRAGVILQSLILLAYFVTCVFISRHGFTWHYFGIAVPFLAIGSAPSIIYWLTAMQKSRVKSLLLTILILVYFLIGFKAVGGGYKKFITNIFTKPDIGFETQASVRKVADEIIKYTKKDDAILIGSQAPLFVADRRIPNTLVKSFTIAVIFRIVKDDSYERHHLISEKKLIQMIDDNEFKLIVDDPYFTPSLSGGVSDALKKRYVLEKEIDNDYKVYLPRTAVDQRRIR